MAFLEVRNIKKNFGKTDILKGIDFDLEKGEVLSIIGSSGSGKTTLLRCINYLEIASEGTIVLNGESIFDGTTASSMSEVQIREKRLHFGLVFQNFNLFPQYSAFENIKLPLSLMQKERVKLGKNSLFENDVDSEVSSLLDSVGLLDRSKFYPCQLSGGQCQRVAIARAMALKPDILCFDEPTSALDPELTGEVLRVIKTLKDKGHTMIIVTHEMNFAQNVSDRVIFMADGIAEESGTPKEVFGNPKSEKLKSFLSLSKNG